MLSDTVFEFPLRVYYEDTDAQGVVYYANYLKYLERARSEWLRHHDMPVSRVAEQLNVAFVVRKVELEYLLPARLDDWLTITLQVMQMSKVGFELLQTVVRENKILVNAQVKLVCVDATTFKLVRIPVQLTR